VRLKKYGQQRWHENRKDQARELTRGQPVDPEAELVRCGESPTWRLRLRVPLFAWWNGKES
jgi:hypothetical protein